MKVDLQSEQLSLNLPCGSEDSNDIIAAALLIE